MVKFLEITTIKKLLQNFTKYSVLLQNQQSYLMALAITLALLHLLLAWQMTTGELKSLRLWRTEIFSYEVPFWGTIILLAWRNRFNHSYNTSIWENSLALLLLIWVVLRTITLSWLDVEFFILSPFIAVFLFGILAIGFQGMKRYWRTLPLLCFMVVPPLSPEINNWLRVSELTTATSAFLLHYIGLNATSHDTLLTLPTGQISVFYVCTGGPLTLILLKFSLLVAIAFPLKWAKKLELALSAIAIGFGLGCIRVAVLAVVVNNNTLFHYWHDSLGTEIFLTFGVFLFAILCDHFIPVERLHPQANETFPDTPTTQWRIPLLLTTWVGVVLAAIYLLFVRPPDRQLLAGATKLNIVSVNGWQQIGAASLSKPTLNLSPGSYGMLASKQYRYLKDSQQLDVKMYYVVYTGYNSMDVWLEYLTGTKVKDIQKNIKKFDGVGYYALTTDANRAYITGCINPRRGSTVTQAQFDRHHLADDFRLNRIVPWLLENDVLRDERCIWMQLSTPLNSATSESAYQLLKSVWTDNYNTWRSQFPPLKM